MKQICDLTKDSVSKCSSLPYSTSLCPVFLLHFWIVKSELILMSVVWGLEDRF